MKGEQKNLNSMRTLIIGGTLVVAILVVGTFWSGRVVNEDTETAVRTVSLLYLDELAGRREQVVASNLNNYVSNMDVAIGLLEKKDLSSVENLQNYQAGMKRLYGLEKFAFIDSNGLIYTSRGTRTDIDKYNIDYKNLSEPKISVKNVDNDNKKVIIAVPVDNLPFEGKNLVACFAEIDMSRMLENISLQSNSNNVTFCNLYTDDGISLANVVLGGFSGEKNLFNAMKQAKFSTADEMEKMRRDFSDGNKGYVSFEYDNIKETMYYVPVEGTNWMLTYLIRESIISSQISYITDRIISRSFVQSILAALILVAMFVAVIIQIRKVAKATLEKETAETENRVKQQELEEQLALQEELLEQEKKQTQQNNMITALASDYRSVYYVNLEQNEAVCYRKVWNIYGSAEEGEKFPFLEKFVEYAHRFVTEEYREDFLQFINPDNIRKSLEIDSINSCRYMIRRNGKESYEMLRMVGINSNSSVINTVGVGFADIDSEMRDSMAKSQALSDALKTAEEASKAKTAFLSNMSHEIRTPMNAIIGLDTLALHEPDISDKTRDYLEKIGNSAQHLLSLINDILDVSRIESGRMVIKNEEFSFSKLLEQINTIFSAQCQEKELIYNCRIKGDIADYYIGDSVKLRQVLINLLGNAVKFTPKGGNVDFIVEKTANFDDRSTIKFTVKDTGIGISKEYLPKMFEAFSQEDNTNTNRYGSTGLGMAITKSIVEMMNGQITVDSEKGIGTTFRLILTLQDSDKKISDEDDNITIRPQEMSVLVVDDDPIACEHAKLVLEKAGISVDTALSGNEALEKVKLRHARREPYNLLIVDWQMPEMDGVEVTRQVRSIIGDETAIIILTAYNWDDIMDEAISAGVDSFIAKPLFSGNLLEEFKNALKKKKITSPNVKKKADLKGRKILLAEDMPVNAEIMMMILQMREIEVDHAENGKIAVEMFEQSQVGHYDAILMDLRMPEMDGLQATQTIRSLKREDAKKIPIIALTANAFDEDVQRSLQAGLNAHLTKPIEPEVLFDTLENMIPA